MDCARPHEDEAGLNDLRALLGVLDRSPSPEAFDDGLHEMLTSIAVLRRRAERRV